MVLRASEKQLFKQRWKIVRHFFSQPAFCFRFEFVRTRGAIISSKKNRTLREVSSAQLPIAVGPVDSSWAAIDCGV